MSITPAAASMPRLLLRSSRHLHQPSLVGLRYASTKVNSPPPSYLDQMRIHPVARSTDTAGPFIMPDVRADRIKEAEKGWKKLGKGEKVGFVTIQTGSLLVVLSGAALASLILYSTGTELFATNSPTRIYQDCVERVEASEELRSLIIPPLTFHGANSSNRLRRNRRVSSSTAIDAQGNEIMTLRFYVEGTAPVEEGETNYMDTLKKWIGPLIFEDSHHPGNYVPTPSIPKPTPLPPPPPLVASWQSWLTESVLKLFGTLVRTKKDAKGETIVTTSLFSRPTRPKPGEFWTGEVTAELRKDPATGNFVYTQCYVDIPESRARNSYRVNVPTANVSPQTTAMAKFRTWLPNKSSYAA